MPNTTIQTYWGLSNVTRMKLARDFAKQHNLKPAEVFMMLEKITPPPATRAASGLEQAFGLVELTSSPGMVESECRKS